MTFELGHRFIQNWKQLPGYERNQLIGELADLVTLLSSDELPAKTKHVAAISETQESLFEDLPESSAWLAPVVEPKAEQNANASQPPAVAMPALDSQTLVAAESEPRAALNTVTTATADLDSELEPQLSANSVANQSTSTEEFPYRISSDISSQMMPGIADLEAIEWGDETEEQLVDEAFFETQDSDGDDSLRLKVEQIVDQWWAVERERLVAGVLSQIYK